MIIKLIRNGRVQLTTNSILAFAKFNLATMSALGYYLEVDGTRHNMQYIEELKEPKCEDDNTIEKVDDCTDDAADSESIQHIEDDEAATTATTASAKTGSKKIRCITNGEIYDSMSAAGRALNIDPASISYAIQKHKATKGFEFERIEEGIE